MGYGGLPEPRRLRVDREGVRPYLGTMDVSRRRRIAGGGAPVQGRALFSLGGLLVAIALLGSCSEPALNGTTYDQPFPAPDFTLTDQANAQFSMDDAGGKVVALTFIYTHCTDVCPIIAVKLRSAFESIGSPDDVAVVAVTTDPQRDTPQVLARYGRTLGAGDGWHFLTGPPDDVQTVWDAYHISVSIPEDTTSAHDHGNTVLSDEDLASYRADLSHDESTLARAIASEYGGGYEAPHSAPIWIIDKSGSIRASLSAQASASDIAHDIETLR